MLLISTVVLLKKCVNVVADYTAKSRNTRIFEGKFHPLRANLDSEKMLRNTYLYVLYVSPEFHNFLNLRVADLPL